MKHLPRTSLHRMTQARALKTKRLVTGPSGMLAQPHPQTHRQGQHHQNSTNNSLQLRSTHQILAKLALLSVSQFRAPCSCSLSTSPPLLKHANCDMCSPMSHRIQSIVSARSWPWRHECMRKCGPVRSDSVGKCLSSCFSLCQPDLT